MKKKITLIIPVYNEADILKLAVDKIDEIMQQVEIDYEILFVDDGSKDKSLEEINKLSKQHNTVNFLSFSRNFGKESAVFAGLENASGDCVVVMDADLQHPPEVIPEMIDLWNQGYEVVNGVKLSRGKESIFYKLSSFIFNKTLTIFTGLNIKNSSDFKLLDKRVVKAILRCKERTRFFRAISEWVGFNQTNVYFHVAPRIGGQTKWSLFKLIKYSIDNIVSFSSIPLKMLSVLGIIAILFAIGLAIQTLVFKLTNRSVEGFTTVILLIIFFGGMILLGLGIIGEYLANIYNEIKARPQYLIKKTNFHTIKKDNQ